jgi:hypothetical protein
MDYSLEKLAKTSDVDAFMQMVEEGLEELSFKKISLLRQKEQYSARYSQLEVDLATVNSEIIALDTVLTSLAESDLRDDMFSKKRKLEYRKFLLEERSEDYGVLALLEKEMEVSLIEQQIIESNNLKGLLEARKTELGN